MHSWTPYAARNYRNGTGAAIRDNAYTYYQNSLPESLRQIDLRFDEATYCGEATVSRAAIGPAVDLNPVAHILNVASTVPNGDKAPFSTEVHT